MDNEIARLLRGAPGPDEAASDAVAERAQQVLRPAGALARLDGLAAWLAGWQRTSRPSVERPAAVVFVADHGVASEGVSAYPAEVTGAMFKALSEGVATASVMARSIGASIVVVDAGVGHPTANFVVEPALTEECLRECFELGRRTVSRLNTDLLVLGEMGIGNTTAASAVTALLLDLPADECTGRGTGIDNETLGRKRAVVDAAKARVGHASPIETLRQVGGSELTSIAGALTEARVRSIPVVLDGFVVTASAAPLELSHPGALDHCVAGHRSSEPGHSLLLERLGKRPILDLDLRLGEGSGALAAIPILRLAAACVTEVATFSDWGLERR